MDNVIQKHIDRLEELKLIFGWLIQGQGVHGLKLSDAEFIDWEWICTSYNVGKVGEVDSNFYRVGSVKISDEFRFDVENNKLKERLGCSKE